MARTGRPKVAEKRTDVIKANATTTERNAFDAACKRAGVGPAAVVRALAVAWGDYVKTTSEPSLQIKVTRKNG